MANSPELLIARIRESAINAEHHYRNGACFHLFLILREVFPQAEAFYDGNHVITRIGEKFYDIGGRITRIPKGIMPLASEPRIMKDAFRWVRRSKGRLE